MPFSVRRLKHFLYFCWASITTLIAIANMLQDGPARIEVRKVPVPPHRMTPLKATWPKIYPPLVEHLKLQVRMNIKAKAVELRTSKYTTDTGALQKGADFVQAFCLGFDVEDSIALLRLDDLYIETFESTYSHLFFFFFFLRVHERWCINHDKRISLLTLSQSRM